METEPASGSSFGEARVEHPSPLRKEQLTNLPVRSRTQVVINEVQEILGYTELHPQVVGKILDLYEKVQQHSEKLKNIDDLFSEMRGVSMPEITRLIERKKEEMMSTIKENTVYVRMIQDDHNNVKYRLSNISVEEKKAREALQATVIKYISTMQGEIRA